MQSITQTDKAYVANTYARFPIEIVSGSGALATDANGKTYIDLGSGIAVNAFGYGDAQWLKAVTEQAAKLSHTSNLYYTDPCAKLAEKLCGLTGMKKVFFGNSGAEANECAIKVARKFALDTRGPGNETIITLKNSFHGRTLATLAATGQDAFHTNFGPFPEGFRYAEPNDVASVSNIVKETGCAAVLLEVVQGEGGVMPLKEDFLKGVQAICRENDMLLAIDEVQTGNGRCGAPYAYMRYGISPDIVTTAKGLGGGLPIGACLIGERAKDTLTPGTHGSTFGGNPVCCAGALSILSRIDDALLSDVGEKSEYIFKALSGAKGVSSVSGLGLMIGVESEKPAAEVVAKCIEKGVLVLTAKSKVRLLPPLTISMEQLKTAISILKEALAQ